MSGNFTLKKTNNNSIKNTFVFIVTLFFSISALSNSGKIDIQDESVLNDPPKITVKGDTLYYDGEITKGSYFLFLKETRGKKIRTFSVNSLGGDMENAMLIGIYIIKNGLDVELRSVCASACANYIFVAGNHKYIGKDSYILWHGGIDSPKKEFEISGNMRPDDFFRLKEYQQLRKKDHLFYKKIGVKRDIAFCPQLQKNYHEEFPEKWFSYSPEDMKRFGIKNISFATTPSQWLMSMRKKHVIFAHYCNQEK
ncbi:hypothetical protein [Erwinia sp.]|uniref:hypothetical protein n=1 Tax=Erwinia citreus TaxID=558 RepID=UPI0028A16FF1|nr:hypothetical protein [Erwinia sp.]